MGRCVSFKGAIFCHRFTCFPLEALLIALDHGCSQKTGPHMNTSPPILMWFRRDLRLSDHPALTKAVSSGRPIIPVFIHDEVVDTHGAAPKWRLGLSVASLARDLERLGSKLILRRGAALDVLQTLIKETGAATVYWSRLYDPASKARDTEVKSILQSQEIEAKSFDGHLLFEPWTVETKTGDFYKVYSPMWKTVKDRDIASCLPRPAHIPAPTTWPQSDSLDAWDMGADMRRGADIVSQHVCVGEHAAQNRLGHFIETAIDRYKADRDFPAKPATSRLSENLTYGEISPRALWHAGYAQMQAGANGAEHFLKEVVWREFAYHLLHHTPHITDQNWRDGWDAFPWNADETADVLAWKQGRTGIRFVDAAMRELYVTGIMHNRARMIVGSYLTKHMMSHWKIGLKWFEDCLIDWDPASNAMGWQWIAGCGPDAAPYFRVFNPDTQIEKFDGDGTYTHRWIAEGELMPHEDALSFFEACPQSWNMSASDPIPAPIVPLDVGRKRALEAYSNRAT